MNDANRAAEKRAEVAAEAAEAAREMSRRAADQGREAVRAGLRVVAGVQEPIADATFNQGRQFLSMTARVANTYCEAAEKTAGDMQALVGSWIQLGRGLQEIQHTWFNLLHQSLERAQHKPQDLLRCASVVELAELQRDIYREAVSGTLEGSVKMFQLAGQIAQSALQPLQSRAGGSP